MLLVDMVRMEAKSKYFPKGGMVDILLKVFYTNTIDRPLDVVICSL